MPACHAGDRRFESGRVRHVRIPSDAPFARPNGASPLSGPRSRPRPVPSARRTRGGACGHPFRRDRVDRVAASARPAPAGIRGRALEGAELPRSSSSPTRRASGFPAGSASTARASPTCSTPTGSSSSSMRSPSDSPTAARWSSPRSCSGATSWRSSGSAGRAATGRARIRTTRHHLVLRSGRYIVAGRIHSSLGQDPLAALRARDPMVPLTDAVDPVPRPARTSSRSRIRHDRGEPRPRRVGPRGRARLPQHRPPAALTSRRGIPAARDYDPRVPATPGSQPPPPGPLAGIRVIDCSTVLAGPFCTMLLGDLGADVIKVEPPEGDATRGWGPPWVGDAAAGTRTAAVLPRRQPEQAEHPARPGGRGRAARSCGRSCAPATRSSRTSGSAGSRGWASPTTSSATLNPGLVHLAISGFGTRGPDAAKPGYDFVIQAVGGLMSITGEPDGRPLKVGVAISDVVSGLFGAVSLLAGLLARERAVGGRCRRRAAGRRAAGSASTSRCSRARSPCSSTRRRPRS